MAGIGFRLKRILKRNTLTDELAAYAYAGVISAGPLILSILGILLIGILGIGLVSPPALIVQFQVSVTYLIATTLILTGAVQLLFTRYIADRLFQHQTERILPACNGVMLITTLCSGLLALALAITAFKGLGTAYRLLMMMGFVIVSNVWVCIVFLASLKRYSVILFAFFVGYATTVVLAVALGRHGLEGLMSGFVVGNAVLLGWMLVGIHREHDASQTRYSSLELFKRPHIYPSLILIGLLFNLGVWLDKFIFWFSAAGQVVIGPLRASVIYDLPIFISYLCIIPGMAIFLLRLETDFSDSYDGYYSAVREGGTLAHIRQMRNDMVRSARISLYEILKIQSVVILLVFAFGDALLERLGMSRLYFPLLRIDVVATSLQVLFLGCLTIFLYLDRRRIVLGLTALFVFLNGALTLLTLQIGPDVYGYGFASALVISVLVAVFTLTRCFDRLEYETYMLQTD